MFRVSANVHNSCQTLTSGQRSASSGIVHDNSVKRRPLYRRKKVRLCSASTSHLCSGRASKQWWSVVRKWQMIIRAFWRGQQQGREACGGGGGGAVQCALGSVTSSQMGGGGMIWRWDFNELALNITALTTPDQLLIAMRIVRSLAHGEGKRRWKILMDQREPAKNEYVYACAH